MKSYFVRLSSGYRKLWIRFVERLKQDKNTSLSFIPNIPYSRDGFVFKIFYFIYRKCLSKYKFARFIKRYFVRLIIRVQRLRYFFPSCRKQLYISNSSLIIKGHSRESVIYRVSSYIYRKHFSKFNFAKFIKPFCIRSVLRITKLFSLFKTGQRQLLFNHFHLLGFSNFFKLEKNIVKRELVAKNVFALNMPVIYPLSYKEYIHSKPWFMKVPSVCAFGILNAEVIGKSDFIFAGSNCLHNDFFNITRDLTSEEMHGLVSLDIKKKMICRRKSKTVRFISGKIINLLGASNGNYIHWLTETAPKLAIIDDFPEYSELPLLVDSNLHPNIIESINYLTLNKRELIFVKKGELCKVQHLISITPVSYVPFDFRPDSVSKITLTPAYAIFVPQGLQLLREKALKPLVREDSHKPKKIYLKRQSNFRKIVNSNEIESILIKNGFDIVESGSLSFVEQVRLFSNVEIIIGQGGAALGNMIFAPKGCHIIVLGMWSPRVIQYYFSNIASILGHHSHLIMCDPVQGTDYLHPAHMDLKVDPIILREVINQ